MCLFYAHVKLHKNGGRTPQILEQPAGERLREVMAVMFLYLSN